MTSMEPPEIGSLNQLLTAHFFAVIRVLTLNGDLEGMVNFDSPCSGLKFVNDLGVLSGVEYKTISICDNKEKTLVLVEKSKLSRLCDWR